MKEILKQPLFIRLRPSKSSEDNGDSVEPVQAAIQTIRGCRGKKYVVESVETMFRVLRKNASDSLNKQSLDSNMRRNKSVHAEPEEEGFVA